MSQPPFCATTYGASFSCPECGAPARQVDWSDVGPKVVHLEQARLDCPSSWARLQRVRG